MKNELNDSDKGNCSVTLVGKKITMFLLVVYTYLLAQSEQKTKF